MSEPRVFTVGERVAVRSFYFRNKIYFGEIVNFNQQRGEYLVDIYALKRHEYYAEPQIMEIPNWLLKEFEKNEGVYIEKKE